MRIMRLNFDLNVGALYIGLSHEPVASTVEIDGNTVVDLDAAGGLRGIEVISFAHRWALSEVLRRYHVENADAAQLRAYFPLIDLGTPVQAPAISSAHHDEPVLVPTPA
jgi:uncharacterized protein YuzE